jgi:hypothetical protein
MRRLDWLIAFLLATVALVVYRLTLTPSLSYLSPDGSELATVPYVLGLAHSPGYPLYTWLGFLFGHLLPLGDVAHRINLMSAVLGALAVGGLYGIIRQLLPASLPIAAQRAVSAASALLFAFSVTFWAQALIAEVYVPNAAFLVFTILALLRWERTRRVRDYFLFALLFGLSLGTHISDLGNAPAFALFTLLVALEPPAGAPISIPLRKIGARALLRRLIPIAFAGAGGFLLGAAQYLWLPLRAGTLNDRVMLRSAPTTLAGLYDYTLGAFPQFKFAFPIAALPDRLVIYLDLLVRQFGVAGVVLGILGLFSLLARRTRYYYLLVGMYLVQVWFFIQYDVFDLDVFFIPAHLVWAVFLAFGAWEILAGLRALAGAAGIRIPHAVGLAGALVLPLVCILPLSANREANDFSQDTAINDFYAGVWSVLPPDAALVTQGGVFGYDAFYWQLAYDTRPDVLLPMLPGPSPAPDALRGREIYATTRAIQNNRGPGALPLGLLSPSLWTVPVLLGQQPETTFGRREALALYRLSDEPPELIANDPHPQFPMDTDFGPLRLAGFDLSTNQVESGGIVKLKLYWRLVRPAVSLRVESRLGDRLLEQHEPGFGLLVRYAQEIGLPAGSIISDEYWLVIPATTAPGTYPLTLQAVGLGNERGAFTRLGPLEVVDEMGTMERWLQIAGN